MDEASVNEHVWDVGVRGVCLTLIGPVLFLCVCVCVCGSDPPLLLFLSPLSFQVCVSIELSCVVKRSGVLLCGILFQYFV